MGGFFDKKRPWSHIKHAMLKIVLENKVFSGGNDLSFTYIDGLAGAGEYKDGSKGSPIVALDVFRDLLEQKPKENIHIDALFFETNEKNYKSLETVLADNKIDDNRITIHSKSGNFYDLLDNAMHMTGQQGLIFIDPFGIKDFSDKAVEKIRNFNRRIDVIFNFPIYVFRRVAGQGKVFEGSKETLERVLGIEYTEEHQKYFAKYMDALRERYEGVNFISLKYRNADLFYVTLCTNDINLYTRFNDFAVTESKFGFLPNNAIDEHEIDSAISKIMTDKPKSQKKLMFSLLNNCFGVYKAKDYTVGIRRMLKKEKLCRIVSYNSKETNFDSQGLTTRIKENIYFKKNDKQKAGKS